ncbi:MAG: formamidopyrimidine-DNA glycosylase [Actinobacteria bacterium]|nr:MAG: formamidopyrimidine-DNA glycosylase [Actinomycetota bacterium]
MPEILEVEDARALIAAEGLGREIASTFTPDTWYLKRGLTPRTARSALVGRRFAAARRRGKLILVDTEGADGPGPVLGLHLGMSGRVVIDGVEAGDPLIYASNRDVPEWRRFGVRFVDGGALYVRDPRRLGAVELEPDEDRLGPDAFELTLRHLRSVTSRSNAPIKAVLMNQARIAGLGNLLVDEALWQAGIDPARRSDSLSAEDQARLHRNGAAGRTPATCRGWPPCPVLATVRCSSAARWPAAPRSRARSTRRNLRTTSHEELRWARSLSSMPTTSSG